MIVYILPLDVPSPLTGFVYSTETMTAALRERRECYGTMVPVQRDDSVERRYGFEHDLTLLSHQVRDMHIKNGWLRGNIKIFPSTPIGAVLKDIPMRNIQWSLSGIGLLKDNAVSDYHIRSVDALVSDNQ